MRNCSINRFTTKKAREPLSGMTQNGPRGPKMTLNGPKWPKMGQKWPFGKRLRISAKFWHWNPKNSEILSKFRNSDTTGASDLWLWEKIIFVFFWSWYWCRVKLWACCCYRWMKGKEVRPAYQSSPSRTSRCSQTRLWKEMFWAVFCWCWTSLTWSCWAWCHRQGLHGRQQQMWGGGGEQWQMASLSFTI